MSDQLSWVRIKRYISILNQHVLTLHNILGKEFRQLLPLRGWHSQWELPHHLSLHPPLVNPLGCQFRKLLPILHQEIHKAIRVVVERKQSLFDLVVNGILLLVPRLEDAYEHLSDLLVAKGESTDKELGGEHEHGLELGLVVIWALEQVHK